LHAIHCYDANRVFGGSRKIENKDELKTITSSQSINLAFAAAIGYERVENREKGARNDGKTE